MSKNTTSRGWLCAIICIGVVMFTAGIVFAFVFPAAVFPFTFMGFGCGLMGVGVARTIQIWRLQHHPDKRRLYEINEHDERNIRLREKAGYTTWLTSMFMLMIMAFVFLILNDQIAGFITIGALVIHSVVFWSCLAAWSKKM